MFTVLGVEVKDWVSGFVGVLVGLAVPVVIGWRRRRIERFGELTAVLHEFKLSRDAITALQHEHDAAPLYRLPTTISDGAIPKLIGEGALPADAITAVVDYLVRAHELNRGLQRAGEAHAASQATLVNEEFARNLEKANEFLNSDRGKSLYDTGLDAINRVRNRHWLLRRRGRIVARP